MTRSSFGLVAQWLVCKSGDTCWCCWYRSWRGGGSEKCNTTLVEVTVTVLLLVWERKGPKDKISKSATHCVQFTGKFCLLVQ